MKQTAIEWLEEQIKITYDKEHRLPIAYILFIIEKAKEMEKDQIINAWIATDNELQKLAAEQYYNKTYNK